MVELEDNSNLQFLWRAPCFAHITRRSEQICETCKLTVAVGSGNTYIQRQKSTVCLSTFD